MGGCHIVKIAAILLLCSGISPAAARETGDLQTLRAEALERVNRARGEHGLAPLRRGEVAEAAAQAHAEAMIQEDFYAHEAPDGGTPMDRFRQHGGSRWRVVRENIARCDNCPAPPTPDRVRAFHAGWMNSPEHRDNILAGGLDSFGFGIAAAEGGRTFAVQVFSGPGMPRGVAADGKPTGLAPERFAERAVAAINAARSGEGLSPVKADPTLSRAAEELLPEPGESDALVRDRQLSEVLPRGNGRRIELMAAACGGCGAEATAEDIEAFVAQWLNTARHRESLLGPSVDGIGFAMRVDGEGRKVGIAIVAR